MYINYDITSIFNKFKKNHINKNVKNSFFSIVDKIFLPAIMILATPFFLNKLGVESYGMWMLINSIISTLGIFNMGGSDATIRYLSHYRKLDDKKNIKKIFTATYSIYVLLTILILLVGLLLIPNLIQSNIFNIPLDTRSSVVEISKIGILLVSLKIFEEVLLAYFKGFERYDISSALSMFSKLQLIIVQIVTVFYTSSLYYVFLNSVIGTFFVIIINMISIRKHNPDINFYLKFEKDKIKEVFSFGIWSWAYSTLGLVSSQLDKWIVASMLGLKALAYYSIAILVFRQLHGVLVAGLSWMFPHISKNGIESPYSKRMYYKSQFLTFSISFIISLFFLIFNDIFLYWLGNEVYSKSQNFIQYFLLLVPLASVTILPYFFLNAGGYIKYNVIYKTVLSISNIILMYTLFLFFDVIGIVLAYAIGYILISSIQRSILEKKFFNESSFLSGFYFLVPYILFIFGYFSEEIILQVFIYMITLISYFLLYKWSNKKR